MQNSKTFWVDALLYGLLVWGIGFVLGMALFPFVDLQVMGWIITIIWLPLTILIAWKRLRAPGRSTSYRALVGVIWVVLAVVLDYLILVKGFAAEAYYDFDIILYYSLSFLTPLLIGFGQRAKTA